METKKAELTLESIEQVADMLWLLNEIETLDVKVEVSVKVEKPEQEPKEINEKPEKRIKKPKKKLKDKDKKEEVASVYENEPSSTKTDIKADPIRMPKKLALSDYRAWEKSFKSFYHKVDSTREFILDEAKTVDIIAKTKLVQPIFKAKKVKYFHLTMLIEQSPSMDIWNELILEFQQTIQRFGVFESIDFYYLVSGDKSVHLYADRNLKREVDAKKLNLHPQTLLTVVSDCVSPAWHSNHIFKMLELWSKAVPVSITQMFPKRMWQGTALYQGFQTSFTSHTFKQLNKNLLSDDGYYEEDEITFNLPVITFQAQSIKAWSSVIYGKRDKWIDGIILEELEERPFPKKNENKKSSTVEERVNRYLSQSSPLAQELARYASVLPISFHVIRVLQALKLPKSSQIHLAEFFLGGLIKREVHEKKNKKKQVSFDFHEGVRDYFRNQLTATTAYKLQDSMSSFVSQNLNSSLDFQALIDNPNSTSGLFLSRDEVAFVKLRADTLRKLGGEYGREGDRLLKKLDLGKEELLDKELKSEFLENFMPLKELKGKDIDAYSRMFNYSFDLPARLARSFSKKHSREIIKEAIVDIVEVYGNIGWIKKLEKNRILWVDDIPKNNTKTVEKFEKIGLKVDLALSTDEALELIERNTYLIVISDMGQVKGKEEGYVLLDKLREFNKDTPFIFFANLDSLENKKMTLKRGGQGITGDSIKLCRMVMNVIEDGRVEEEVVNPSIILIESKINKSFITGFSIQQDKGGSYIVTLAKALDSINIREIKIEDFEVSVYSIGSTAMIDLVILYVKGLFVPPLKLAIDDFSSREVYTIKYNILNNEYNQNKIDGIIVGDKVSIFSSEEVDDKLDLWKMVSSSRSIEKGYSGAPLISKENSKVIGIISHKERNEKLYAIPINYLKDRIDKEGILPFKHLIPFGLKDSNLYFSNKQMADSVVLINSKKNKAFGTGFVVHQDEGGSYIITANFVIEATVEPIVNYQYSVEVIRISEIFELAILYVKDFYTEPFLLESENFSSREIEIMGYDTFLENKQKKEIIEAQIISNDLIITDSNEKSYRGWEVMLNKNYKVGKGFGGSPLVSKENGKVVGIFIHRRASGTEGYAISIEHLKDVWNDK